jgi:hypothetical protein
MHLAVPDWLLLLDSPTFARLALAAGVPVGIANFSKSFFFAIYSRYRDPANALLQIMTRLATRTQFNIHGCTFHECLRNSNKLHHRYCYSVYGRIESELSHEKQAWRRSVYQRKKLLQFLPTCQRFSRCLYSCRNWRTIFPPMKPKKQITIWDEKSRLNWLLPPEGLDEATGSDASSSSQESAGKRATRSAAVWMSCLISTYRCNNANPDSVFRPVITNPSIFPWSCSLLYHICYVIT